MKKLLVCGVICSILSSFGSMSFAAGPSEPDFCSDTIVHSGYKYTRDGSSVSLTIADDWTTLFLINGKDISNIVSFVNDNPLIVRSAGGLLRTVSFKFVGNKAHIVDVDVFVNYGNGVWLYYEDMPIFNDMEYIRDFHSRFQYKCEITFVDGTRETVKFMGSDLFNNINRKLDMGVVCLEDIKIWSV